MSFLVDTPGRVLLSNTSAAGFEEDVSDSFGCEAEAGFEDFLIDTTTAVLPKKQGT